MEQPNRESCSPGRASSGPERSSVLGGPEYNLRNIRANLEEKLEGILLGSASGTQKPPPGPDPNPPTLPSHLASPMSSDLGQPWTLPLTGTDKKYPLMRQRGFYSDILSPGSLDQLGVSVPSLNPPCVPFSCPSIHPSISPSFHLSTYPSVYPSLNLSA